MEKELSEKYSESDYIRDYNEFLKGEARYAALQKIAPQLAEKLYNESKKFAEERYNKYLELANKDFSNN